MGDKPLFIRDVHSQVGHHMRSGYPIKLMFSAMLCQPSDTLADAIHLLIRTPCVAGG